MVSPLGPPPVIRTLYTPTRTYDSSASDAPAQRSCGNLQREPRWRWKLSCGRFPSPAVPPCVGRRGGFFSVVSRRQRPALDSLAFQKPFQGNGEEGGRERRSTGGGRGHLRRATPGEPERDVAQPRGPKEESRTVGGSPETTGKHPGGSRRGEKVLLLQGASVLERILPSSEEGEGRGRALLPRKLAMGREAGESFGLAA